MSHKTFYILFFLLGCIKEEKFESDYPLIITAEVEEINSSGALFSADIINQNSNDIINHGFLWGKSEDLTLNTASKFYTQLGSLNNLSFKQTINSTLIKDNKYYVRAYIQTTTKTIYGSIVSFKSLGSKGPKLIKIEPSIANIGDTVTLIGASFSLNPSDNEVEIDGLPIKVISSTESMLKIIIPRISLGNPKISIRIADSKSEGQTNLLTVKVPRIEVTNTNALACDTLILNLINRPTESIPIVYYNSALAFSKLLNPQTIKTISPVAFQGPLRISIVWEPGYATSTGDLKFAIPEIISTNPFVIDIGEEFFINGKNFSGPITMKIDNIPVQATLLNSETIVVKIDQSFSLNPDVFVSMCSKEFTLIDAFQEK
jgi:IPT/TIG domain